MKLRARDDARHGTTRRTFNTSPPRARIVASAFSKHAFTTSRIVSPVSPASCVESTTPRARVALAAPRHRTRQRPVQRGVPGLAQLRAAMRRRRQLHVSDDVEKEHRGGKRLAFRGNRRQLGRRRRDGWRSVFPALALALAPRDVREHEVRDVRRVRAELALEPGTGTGTGTGTGIGTDDERDDERDGPYRTSQSVDGDARESRRGDAEMETERRAAGEGI